jgi:uroporphyrinogen-III decarboxylase
MLLFGNLDPYQDLELSSDAELIMAMKQQIEIGKRYGRFVVSTGSPITPGTSLERVQNYIRWAHGMSVF